MKEVYGKETLVSQPVVQRQGLAPSGEAVDVLLSWIFQPEKWSEIPVVQVKGNRFRQALGLDVRRTHFSERELTANAALSDFHHKAIEKKKDGIKNLPDFENKTLAVINSISLLRWVAGAERLSVIPATDEEYEKKVIAAGLQVYKPTPAERELWRQKANMPAVWDELCKPWLEKHYPGQNMTQKIQDELAKITKR